MAYAFCFVTGFVIVTKSPHTKLSQLQQRTRDKHDQDTRKSDDSHIYEFAGI